MTVTAVRKDPQRLTMTIEAEFDASPERVWQLWADPRQLERWWGPPTYPATFTAHDLAPGSHVEFHMTGPTGDKPRGYWDILESDPPRRLVFLDGFANADGTPNPDYSRNEGRVTIERIDDKRTRMSIEFQYASTKGMEQYLAMRMEEGLDTGDVAAVLREPIRPDDTAGSLSARLSTLGAQLVVDTLPAIEQGTVILHKQDDAQATFAPPLSKADGQLAFTEPAEVVSARARGVDPWPGATLLLQGEVAKVFGPTVVEGTGQPGEVLGPRSEGLAIACGGGVIAFAEIQLPGRKRMPAKALLAGHPIPPGTVVGALSV